MAKVKFFHVFNEDKPDDFMIEVDGKSRPATVEDKKQYRKEYNDEKALRAASPKLLREDFNTRQLRKAGLIKPEEAVKMTISKADVGELKVK